LIKFLLSFLEAVAAMPGFIHPNNWENRSNASNSCSLFFIVETFSVSYKFIYSIVNIRIGDKLAAVRPFLLAFLIILVKISI